MNNTKLSERVRELDPFLPYYQYKPMQDELADEVAELEALRDSFEEMYKCLRKYWPEGTVNGLVEEYRRLQAENAELRARIKTLTAQRDTAYGYGSDGGAPPWMK